MQFIKTFIIAALLPGLFLVPVKAQDSSFVKSTTVVSLGETGVRINVYEKAGNNITFVAPHYNEQAGTKIAKESIRENGGRLVEVESFDRSGNPSRRLSFKFEGKYYSIDPNRVFTDNGRQCGNIAPEIDNAVKDFARSFLKIVLSGDSNRLRDGEKFLVAVHNNSDVDDKSEDDKANDLTAVAFVKNIRFQQSIHGAFQEQAEGVYLSNVEDDKDNFVFLSTPAFIGFFAEKGFNVVVQKSAARLQSQKCSVDDGSLSVFAGQQNIPYINLEADAKNGSFRQKQMIEAVYELLQGNVKAGSRLQELAVK